MTSELAQTQAERGWTLRRSLFAAAFPFHLVLDRDLRVLQAGPSLHRLCPGIQRGAPLDTLFTVTTPRSASTFEAMAARTRSIFLLRGVADRTMTLRGQMLYDETDGVLFFVGSPWVTDTAALGGLGLTLDDFAVSDAVIDYALLLQNQAASLATARELAARLQASTEELTHQAFHDALTGLPNRNRFAERVQAVVAPDHDPDCDHFSVLMLDLDGFKAVNDSYGHSAGDELLRIVAERLRHITRPGDVVARLGGDEFAILVVPGERPGGERTGGERAGTPKDGRRSVAADVADRAMAVLRESVSLPFPVDVTIQVAASVGIAECGGARTADDILRNADLAMYVAKADGKNRHQRFEPAMHSMALARIELATALRAAVAGEQMLLHYQPIVDTRSGQITGVEALLRWPHPQRGFVPPDEFIPIAESIGLIEELGDWVLRTACAQVSQWERLTVAVNVSPLQLGPALPRQVRAALAAAGLAPERLTLEITETLLAGEDRQVLASLREIAGTGVRLSVDDFGTGHSSLSRLHTFPIHELKIDKSFVMPLGTGEPNGGLVAGIIALAHGIELEVVAEGVERAEAYLQLQHLGCERAQGYHLGRPVPPQDIDVLVVQRPTHRPAGEPQP